MVNVLCICSAGTAQASVVTDMVTRLAKGCSSGMGSQVCKSAMTWASGYCQKAANGSNCVAAATQLCRNYKTICVQVSGPLCKATGTYAKQCDLAVKAITNPAGALTSLLG